MSQLKAVLKNNVTVSNQFSNAWNRVPQGNQEITYWVTVTINPNGTLGVNKSVESSPVSNDGTIGAANFVVDTFINKVLENSLKPSTRLYKSILEGGRKFYMRVYLRKRPSGSTTSTDVDLHRNLVKQKQTYNGQPIISAMQALWYVENPNVSNNSKLAETVFIPKYTMKGAKVVKTPFRRATHMTYGRPLNNREKASGIAKYKAKKGTYISFIPEIGYHAVIKSPSATTEPSRSMILSHLFVPKRAYDKFIGHILPKSSKRFKNTAENTAFAPTKFVSSSKTSARDIVDDILGSRNAAMGGNKNMVKYGNAPSAGNVQQDTRKLLKEFKRSGITPLPPRIRSQNNAQIANLLKSPDNSGVFMVNYKIKNAYYPDMMKSIYTTPSFLDYYMKNFAYEIFIGYSKYIKRYGGGGLPHFIMGGFATKLYVEKMATSNNVSNIPQRNLDKYVFNTHDIDAHTIISNPNISSSDILTIAGDFAEYMKGFLGYLTTNPNNVITKSTIRSTEYIVQDQYGITTDPRFQMVVSATMRRNAQGQALTLNNVRGLSMVAQVQALITFNGQEIFVYEFGITVDEKKLGTNSYKLNQSLTNLTGLPIPTIKSLLMEQASLFFRERFRTGSGRNNTKKLKTYTRLRALLSVLKSRGNSTINTLTNILAKSAGDTIVSNLRNRTPQEQQLASEYFETVVKAIAQKNLNNQMNTDP